jgi:hypothetical protein
LARGAGVRPRTRVRNGLNDAGPSTIKAPATSTATATLPHITTKRTALEILDDPIPGLPPPNPADPDSGPGTGQISPLFALGAFGIATGLVLFTAGLGAWGVARLLDVRDVSYPCPRKEIGSAVLMVFADGRIHNKNASKDIGTPTPNVSCAI